ncbi:hypothetical protein FHS18_006672 [Paenibacillus phyllosphaerae]|uniref:Uncharacterized protein n=1 Tax=Paenibacillus phyllosphaerae TaxID=274593 RepID=A0A7W5FRH5_9BACL|nr:hypothetical protein [Paenibacillus phyllosphaerae]
MSALCMNKQTIEVRSVIDQLGLNPNTAEALLQRLTGGVNVESANAQLTEISSNRYFICSA